jgi:hypothetical protein
MHMQDKHNLQIASSCGPIASYFAGENLSHPRVPGHVEISIATLHCDYIDLCGPIAFVTNIVRRKSR